MARGFQPASGANAEVREALNPDLSKAELLPLGSSRRVAVREAVAGRPDCPLGLMVTLAHDHHPGVRRAVASNPSAQRSVLAYLAADRHVEVVWALLGNPSLPSEILDELSLHKKSAVREAAAERLNAGTALGREEARESHVFEDALVPEMAEHVAPGPLNARAARGQTTDEASGGPSAEPAVAPAVPEPTASEPVWTRTAPVRGFRPPR